MVGWYDVSFMHLSFVPYLSPPDVVCLILSSKEGKAFDSSSSWRAVTRATFGALTGPRGHLSRMQRKKKGTWRAGDGAKARLSLLFLEQTQANIARLQAAHLSQQRDHEDRWVLKQSAAVMRGCSYASSKASECRHVKIRLWTSATAVASRYLPRSQEQPLPHPGLRCDRCNVGPVRGFCYRCSVDCCSRGITRETTSARGLARRRRHQTGPYTLCEECYSRRSDFHPPHPFARLRPCLAHARLTGPGLYEAVCGDCSFGSLILIQPLKVCEVGASEPDKNGWSKPKNADIWAVPVRVEAAGPVPLSRVKSHIAAANRDDDRGLAFASDKWRGHVAPVSD